MKASGIIKFHNLTLDDAISLPLGDEIKSSILKDIVLEMSKQKKFSMDWDREWDREWDKE